MRVDDRATKIKETIKTLLMVFLGLLTILLLLSTWFYAPTVLPDGVGRVFGIVDGILGIGLVPREEHVPEQAASRAENYGAAVYPVRYTMTLENGKYSTGYNPGEAAVIEGRIYDLLGECFASSSEPVTAGESEWRRTLTQAGMYMEFSDSAPLSLIALMYGVSLPSQREVYTSSIFMSADKDRIVIYYTDELSGGILRADTASPSRELLAELENAEPNGYIYLFEQDGNYVRRGTEVMTAENLLRIPVVQKGEVTPSELMFDGYLEVFKTNPISTYKYLSDDGTFGAIDDQRSITLSTDAVVIYRDRSPDKQRGVQIRDEAGDNLVIEQLRRIAVTARTTAADAGISLRRVEHDGERRIVSFGYDISGIPVMPGGREPIVFIVEDGILVYARIELRKYTPLEEMKTMLPVEKAVLLMEESGETDDIRRFGICYVENGGQLTPMWYHN